MISTEIFKPVVDWLTYRSYESNRIRNPDITYYKWRKIYKDAALFEDIFEANLKRIYSEGVWGNDNSSN